MFLPQRVGLSLLRIRENEELNILVVTSCHFTYCRPAATTSLSTLHITTTAYWFLSRFHAVVCYKFIMATQCTCTFFLNFLNNCVQYFMMKLIISAIKEIIFLQATAKFMNLEHVMEPYLPFQATFKYWHKTL